MSKYTTEVRFICEVAAGYKESQGYSKVDEIVTKAAPAIFEQYPIYDESHRLELNKKILRHYYTQEIGFEVVGLWKLYLNNRMHEIMPYYNKLYKLVAKEFDLFDNVNLSATEQTDFNTQRNQADTSESNGNTNRSGSANRKSRYSDTPQGALTDLEDDSYLSSAEIAETADSDITNTSNNSKYNSGTTGADKTEKTTVTKGKNGGLSYAELLEQYQAQILDIDMMIINNLADLFMGLW